MKKFLKRLNPVNWSPKNMFFFGYLIYLVICPMNLYTWTKDFNAAIFLFNLMMFIFFLYSDYWRRRDSDMEIYLKIDKMKFKAQIEMFHDIMGHRGVPFSNRQSQDDEPIH